MVFLLRLAVAYTLPQLQHQMKINIVPGDFTDMPECDSYCFRESVYWQCHIILFRARKYNQLRIYLRELLSDYCSSRNR